NDMLDGLILNRTPHIKLYNELKASDKQPIELAHPENYHIIHSIKPDNEKQAIRNAPAIMAELKKDNKVEGVAPKITTQVFYNVGTTDMTGIINGIDVEEENRLFRFSDYVTYGDFIDLKNIPNSIILGKNAADKMLADIGDV